MNIFEYSDYKLFVRERVQAMPGRGRGQFRQMALKLGVNSTVVSQVFKGARDLSPEQALKLAGFLGLGPLETKYFVNLILIARAGSKDLQDYFRSDLKKLKAESANIKTRVVEHQEVSDEAKALFYSNWYYSGIRNLSAIPGYDHIDPISEYFGLSRALVKQVVDFLLQAGLITEVNGKLKPGTLSTHLDAKSPLINGHRRNWRMKALEKLDEVQEPHLFYSSPMSLSKEDKFKIREELVATISKISKRVEKSPEEELACLNIDWFGF